MKSLLNSLSYVLSHPLNQKRKIGAIKSVLAWQIASKILKKPLLLDWIDGTKCIIRPGEHGMTQNIYCGIQDFQEMAFILHYMRPEDLFLDIGANSGSYTLLACGVCGSMGAAFEPTPVTFERLYLNCAINQLFTRVEINQCALGDRTGEIDFSIDDDCMNHPVSGLEEPPENTIKVPIKELDSLSFKRSPTTVKVDVEGFETEVWNGGQKVFENSDLNAIIIELNGSGKRYGFDEDSLQQRIEAFGFSPYTYHPFERSLVPQTDNQKIQGNGIFIRDAEHALLRIKSSKLFHINGVSV